MPSHSSIRTWTTACALLLQALLGAAWLEVGGRAAPDDDCCGETCLCFEVARTSCCSGKAGPVSEQTAKAPVVRSACGCGHHGAPSLRFERAPLALVCERSTIEGERPAPAPQVPVLAPPDRLQPPDTPPPRFAFHDRSRAS